MRADTGVLCIVNFCILRAKHNFFPPSPCFSRSIDVFCSFSCAWTFQRTKAGSFSLGVTACSSSSHKQQRRDEGFHTHPVQNPESTRILCKSRAPTPAFFQSSALHCVNSTRSGAAPASRAPSAQLAGISLVSACYSSTDPRAEGGETRSIHDSPAHVVTIPEGRSKRYGSNTNPG